MLMFTSLLRFGWGVNMLVTRPAFQPLPGQAEALEGKSLPRVYCNYRTPSLLELDGKPAQRYYPAILSGHPSPLTERPGLSVPGSKREMAFHEQAGRSQVDACLFLLGTFSSPAEWPLSPCFHPHSRGANCFARCMLDVLGSAGAAICLAPCGSALFEWTPG
jgi:hypothetical protein